MTDIEGNTSQYREEPFEKKRPHLSVLLRCSSDLEVKFAVKCLEMQEIGRAMGKCDAIMYATAVC
ncbi:hypothetical protein H8A97_16365 [Bradyrhizobium sp. Arg62]|uniref:hypothetical protein n=1 Tax=Bradyrhizobium brasilense TaxID=1419277 RepID=UPI001E2F0018|nr:hypothetical protein [Bradyrhizobium brasilense]MCC8946640.1 hypothetical protein [Bradyrhizobium brasilense]